MRIENVKLKNIRSYEDGYVEFPDGSILLSGEVGSGKSSLLLAIEFALFGIRRGELSGEALLRRGKKSGSVKLTFSIDGRRVVISRTLQRTFGSVRQNEGYITIGGVKSECTPTELKARVLDLLGYPHELLHKQKSLLYRYTVYTPQEQVKEIIRADSEERLDSLRKIFGVDRYKLIKENIAEFLREVRAKRRELSVVYRDLDKKIEERREQKNALGNVNKVLSELREKKSEIDKERTKWRRKKEKIEEKIDLYNEYDKTLGQKEERLRNLEKEFNKEDRDLKKKIEEFETIKKLEPPTDSSDTELQKRMDERTQRIEKYLTDPSGADESIDKFLKRKEGLAKRIEEKKEKITAIETMTKSLNDSIQQLIEAENICPVCGRKLDEKHKNETREKFEQELERNVKENEKIRKTLRKFRERLETVTKETDNKIKRKIAEIRKEITAIKELREKLGDYNEKLRDGERIKKEIETLIDDKKKLETAIKGEKEVIMGLRDKLADLKGVKSKKKEIENQLQTLQDQLNEVSKKIGSHAQKKQDLKIRIEELKEEIDKKQEAKQFSIELGSFEDWFVDYLMNLAGTIERHYLLELRSKFDPLFRDWFNLLIDDELLNVRIDDEFIPVIEQEGYEAEYENLSGGESASVALAYRLALNKVINTLIENIKSRDLIILDEPTDGFSNDQLDKIRDIISQLGTKQIIIVSHEPKIESYVENIIRINKEGGISTIQEIRS